MAPFDKSQTSWYWSSVVNMALICIISEIKRDTGRNSKITTFAILSALEVPVRRGSPSEYCHKVWYGKTRMVCLPDGEKKSAGMSTRFDATHERDEHDRETDSARRQAALIHSTELQKFTTESAAACRRAAAHGTLNKHPYCTVCQAQWTRWYGRQGVGMNAGRRANSVEECKQWYQARQAVSTGEYAGAGVG